MATVVIYSETDSLVVGRVMNVVPSAHTPDYVGKPGVLINPSKPAAMNLSNASKYKYNGSALVKMSSSELATVFPTIPEPEDLVALANSASTVAQLKQVVIKIAERIDGGV